MGEGEEEKRKEKKRNLSDQLTRGTHHAASGPHHHVNPTQHANHDTKPAYMVLQRLEC